MNMTNLLTLFQSDDQLNQVLAIYLSGGSTLIDLTAALAPWLIIDFSHSPATREIQVIAPLPDVELTVSKKHLCYMLEQYELGHISEKSLSDWAAFIFLTPFYVTENEILGLTQDKDDVVGDLLQRLMTPEIFDGLDAEVVSQYKRILDCQ